KKINQLEEGQIDKMKTDFQRVMEWSFKIWGRANFRIPTDQTRGTINTAILESVCNFIASKPDDFIKKNKAVIKENYATLIDDETYYESVTKSTGNKTKVLDRFRIAHEILNQDTND